MTLRLAVMLLLSSLWVSSLWAPREAHAMESERFDALMSALQAGRYDEVEAYLEPREATTQADPEFYVVLLNYSLRKANQGGMVIAKGEGREGDMALQDRETGEVVGFMGHREAWDEALLLDAIRRTQNALPGFRTRLDIHFGLVHAAERIPRWDIVAEQIVAMLETSRAIDNAWTWGPIGSMDGEPQEFMIQNVLPRASRMFQAETKDADRAFVRVSEALVEHYPDLVYGHTNLGVLAIVDQRYDDARTHLERARALEPNDAIVLGNLDKLAELEKADAGPAKSN